MTRPEDIPAGLTDRRFLFTYRFEGADYGFDIVAKDAAEAKARVRQIALARYDGEIFATVKIPFGGLLARLFGWRNV